MLTVKPLLQAEAAELSQPELICQAETLTAC